MTDLEQLCNEIKEKAFKIEKMIHGVPYVQYFVTNEQELYKKLGEVKLSEIEELTNKLGVPLHRVNLAKNLIYIYSPLETDGSPERYYAVAKNLDSINPIFCRWIKEAAGVDSHGDSIAYR